VRQGDEHEPSAPEPGAPRAEEASPEQADEAGATDTDAEIGTSPFESPPMDRVDLSIDHRPPKRDGD
jgi:hypothetical protein